MEKKPRPWAKLPELIEAATSKPDSRGDELKHKLQDVVEKWETKTYCDDYSKNYREKLARELWLDLGSMLK